MAKSINQDVYAGSSVYHIQTEYYKSSGKIVTNIFKDGCAIKRLEKDVSGVPEEEIDREIEEFHYFVLDRLRQGAKRKKEVKKEEPAPVQEEPSKKEEKVAEEAEKRPSLEIPSQLRDSLLKVMFPYFGIASAVALDNAVSESSDYFELVENLVSGLSPDEAQELRSKLEELLEGVAYGPSQALEEEEAETSGEAFSVGSDIEEKILSVLSDYFGIMASAVFEEALEDWEMTGKTYDELVDIIAAHADTEEEAEEIARRLRELTE